MCRSTTTRSTERTRHPNRTLAALAAALTVLTAARAVGADPSDDESDYAVTRRDDDPHFLTAITRVGRCKIQGPPQRSFRISEKLYPKESVKLHEEGTAQLRLTLDTNHCVSKAEIVKSSGFWRLDAVSLQFAMTLKLATVKPIPLGGHITAYIPMAWGASQAPLPGGRPPETPDPDADAAPEP